MKYEMKNPFYCLPPGSSVEFLSHPSGDSQNSCPKAIFKEHRFSFFWWNKWTQEKREKNKNYRADIITLDYHNDLCSPDESEIEDLKILDVKNDFEVAFLSWARLNGNSDSHILSAAYLNIIGDIYALTKLEIDEEISVFEDLYGNKHKIYIYHSLEELTGQIIKSRLNQLFLDVDLDYFIVTEGLYGARESWEIVKDEEFKNIINNQNDLFRHIIRKIDGITIALEPDYTGSLTNSCELLINFERQLLDQKGYWQHLQTQ